MTHAPQFKLGDPNTPAHSLPAAAFKRLLDAEDSGLTIEYWAEEENNWVTDHDFDPFEFDTLAYRIKPDDTPKLWRDMTGGEKGELLLAHHEGASIQIWNHVAEVWRDPQLGEILFQADRAYRVEPAATREPIKIQGPSGEILGSGTMLRRDGEWDFDSIEVEDR